MINRDCLYLEEKRKHCPSNIIIFYTTFSEYFVGEQVQQPDAVLTVKVAFQLLGDVSNEF